MTFQKKTLNCLDNNLLHEGTSLSFMTIFLQNLKWPYEAGLTILTLSVSDHLRVVWHMRVAAFYFDPASQVEWTAVADIDVLGRQEVNHVHDESGDPHQNHVLSDPPRVVVQRVL